MEEEVYYLKFIMKDGSVMYTDHSTYVFNEKPSLRSLMTLQAAKAKKTKMLKQQAAWSFNPDDVYQDIEICKATITYDDGV